MLLFGTLCYCRAGTKPFVLLYSSPFGCPIGFRFFTILWTMKKFLPPFVLFFVEFGCWERQSWHSSAWLGPTEIRAASWSSVEKARIWSLIRQHVISCSVFNVFFHPGEMFRPAMKLVTISTLSYHVILMKRHLDLPFLAFYLESILLRNLTFPAIYGCNNFHI